MPLLKAEQKNMLFKSYWEGKRARVVSELRNMKVYFLDIITVHCDHWTRPSYNFTLMAHLKFGLIERHVAQGGNAKLQTRKCLRKIECIHEGKVWDTNRDCHQL